jgi:hypothetical protein
MRKLKRTGAKFTKQRRSVEANIRLANKKDLWLLYSPKNVLSFTQEVAICCWARWLKPTYSNRSYVSSSLLFSSHVYPGLHSDFCSY